ncbi:MAG TPA: D-arabinono-1,4-lactone oxidase, partial [Metabacillus sp.]|nr:D-arabinono-1,4-lactone oxidase [Metabacillus sp.]
IGGSLSANAHGRDIRFGHMADTVKEMTLLTPTGDIKTISHDDEDQWMKHVFGGYGLFGIILDVTLELTDNNVYTIHTKEIETDQYEPYLTSLLNDKGIAMHYARISVAPKSFLDEMYVIDYKNTDKIDKTTPLKKETGIKISKFALDVGRQGGWLEDLFWETQKQYIRSLNHDSTTRNNAMRSESTFMEFTQPGRVEVLQEFFVPVNEYEEYISDLKKLLSGNDHDKDFKIHNITVRYVAKDEVTSLHYATKDMLGLVVLIQHGVKEEELEEAKDIIQKWTNLTIRHGGTYYLPYYPYQTLEQFHTAYPSWKNFQEEKRRKDPNGVFQNLFYEHYLK